VLVDGVDTVEAASHVEVGEAVDVLGEVPVALRVGVLCVSV
jgi:hypothetical protein